MKKARKEYSIEDKDESATIKVKPPKGQRKKELMDFIAKLKRK